LVGKTTSGVWAAVLQHIAHSAQRTQVYVLFGVKVNNACDATHFRNRIDVKKKRLSLGGAVN
jgi:hypothetical protein